MNKLTHLIFPLQRSDEYIMLGLTLLPLGIIFGASGHPNFFFLLHILNIAALITLIALSSQEKTFTKYYRWVITSVLIVLLTTTTVISAEVLGASIFGNTPTTYNTPTGFLPMLFHMSFLVYALIAQIGSGVLLIRALFGKTSAQITRKSLSKKHFTAIAFMLIITFPAYFLITIEPVTIVNIVFVVIPAITRAKLLS